MLGRNSTILTVAVIVTLVLIASYLVYGNESDEASIGVGDRMDYLVFGNFDTGETIEGTSSWTIVEETDDQFRFEMTQSVYAVGAGGWKMAISEGTVTEWSDKTSRDDGFIACGTMDIGTFWGERTLGWYVSEDGATSILADGDLMYAFMYEGDGYTLYMELDGCTALGEKRADREIHSIVIGMDVEAEGDGYALTGTEVLTIDNGRTEIFKEATESVTMYMGEDSGPYSVTQKSWYDPFDTDPGAVMTGTETIDTAWGERQVDVYETDLDGQKAVLYLYDDNVPLRMDIERDGIQFEFETVTLMLDGEDVDPEDIDLKSMGFAA